MKTEDYINRPGYALGFAAIGEPRTQDAKLRIILHGSMDETALLIHPHSSVESFQVDFPAYAAYSVVADHFTASDKNEVYEGSTFRVYEKSIYLDFFFDRAGGHELVHAQAGKEYKHYSFLCFDHVVDVISSDFPVIVKIDPEE
ncbi:hypothetical protein M4S82_11280 [Planococcus sp. MERTA32b]|nr:hypothetical protein [Planococcus sp. MER TA 32b]